jgi:hypothetical protein
VPALDARPGAAGTTSKIAAVRRYWVVGTAILLVAAVAVPAWAGADNFVVRALGIAKEARDHADVAKKRSKRAKREANKALNRANRALDRIRKAKTLAKQAQSAAERAQSTANQAEDAAEDAQAALAATRTVSSSAGGSVSTDSPDPVSLGGPTVTVTVPQSGLIEVFAQATTDGGAVILFEDGNQVPGQAEVCASGAGALFAETAGAGPIELATPAGFGLECGSTGAPGPVLFQRTPGEHIYELRYEEECSCTGTATFSDRGLWVRPVL